MMEDIKLIKDDTQFHREVLDNDRPVCVCFYAQWCEDSANIADALDTLAGEFAPEMDFLKIDVEAQPGICTRYNITATPTVMLFRDGEVCKTWIDERDIRAYRMGLEEVLART